jgi:hypothetical protein
MPFHASSRNAHKSGAPGKRAPMPMIAIAELFM